MSADLLPSLEAMIKCSFCQDRIDNPRVLGCLHSFCFECLENYQATNQYKCELICPVCKKTTIIKNGKIEELPKDFRMTQIKDVLETREKIEIQENKDTASGVGNPDEMNIIDKASGNNDSVSEVCADDPTGAVRRRYERKKAKERILQEAKAEEERFQGNPDDIWLDSYRKPKPSCTTSSPYRLFDRHEEETLFRPNDERQLGVDWQRLNRFAP